MSKGVKFDKQKVRWDLIHWQTYEDVAKVLTFGAVKYSDDNWKKVLRGERGPDRYFAAAMRHLVAWKKGEIIDPESGLPHLAHAQCCLMFLQAYAPPRKRRTRHRARTERRTRIQKRR
jgi:hypothetical protein